MSKPRKLPSGRWQIRWFGNDGKRKSATFAKREAAVGALRRFESITDTRKARRMELREQLEERMGPEAAAVAVDEELRRETLTVSEAFEAFMARRKRDP